MPTRVFYPLRRGCAGARRCRRAGWWAALAHRPEVGLGDWSTWFRAGIAADRVGRWKGLAPTAVADLWEIAGEVAVQAGYPPIATEARPEPADAVRRHQLAMHLQAMKRS